MDEKNVRIPPNNIEAEKSVLGAILYSAEVLIDVVDILRADDFYRKDHAMIYETMLSLFNKNKPVDFVTVTEQLSLNGSLEKVGGITYVASLADDVPVVSNAKQYAEIVAAKALQRRLIKSAYDISSMAYEPEGDVNQVLEMAEKTIFDVAQNRSNKAYVHIKGVLSDVFTKIEYLSENKALPGVPTGFHDLDKLLSGMHNSDLILIAARPAMGKTALMLNIAQYVAVNKNIPVAIFNLEMSKEQLVTRILSSYSKVESEKLKTGNIAAADWSNLATAFTELSGSPIYIDDSTDVSISSIRAKCRRLKLERDIKLVIIDYLQLMQGKQSHSDNRVQEVSDISRSLKLMARELDVPIIVGSQLSRAVESRKDNRPMLSDLRESGAIEQDADIVTFLYREDYYNPDTPIKNVAELIIAKHRNGPTGVVKLSYDPTRVTFRNMTFSPS